MLLLPIFALLLQQAAAQPAAAPAGRIVVTPANPRVVAGDTIRLTAQVLDPQGRALQGATVRYQVAGAEQVAEVDSTGRVVGIVPGSMPVAAVAVVPNARPIVARLEIRVTPAPASRVSIATKPQRMLVGQRLRLPVTAYTPQNDPAADAITWSSSAPAVVRVDNGALVAVAAGRATLTAAAGKGSDKFDVTVVAGTVSRVEITPATTAARTGDVIRFKVSARDAAGRAIEGLVPQWSFSPGQGVIDAEGAFVGYAPGTYVVTANLGPRVADATVTLADRDVRRRTSVVGSVIRTAFPTSEVWVHPNGKVAYLGTHLGGDRLYTIDISNPASPTIVDSVVANTRLVNDIMTDEKGEVLVFTRESADDRKNGIVIATLEDPLRPKVVAHVTEGVTGGVHSAFIHTQAKYGRHIYLTNDATGAVHVIDINDPAKPKELAIWKTPRLDAGRYVHDIDVQDGLLYGSWWNDGLVILDVGNGIAGGTPDKPVMVSQYKYDLDALYKKVGIQSGPGFVRGTHTAWRHKNYVFIADEVFGLDAIQELFAKKPSRAYGRLQVIDVSDVKNPKSVAWYEPEYGGVHNLWVAGDTLYMGAYNAGFRAFDISGELRGDLTAQGREIADYLPASPNGAIPNAPMTWGVVVKNGLAYVNDFNSGLWIVRMEPKAPPVP